MAILDFLVPDLAPEQYSSGQGTGYAQQYNLGAPNPFDVAQDYMNSMLQQKKLEQEKDLLNEKTRQEKLNQYISSIEYDPKWEIAKSDFENKVNEIGDFVSEWRASGKPINQDFHMGLNKLKGELNTMKSENEKTFETFNKNMQTMLGSLGKDYNEEDVKKYDKAVTEAYDRGGINEGFKTITTIKPIKQFELLKYLKENFPEPVNEKGDLLETKPEDLDRIALDKYTDLSDTRKQQIIDELFLNNRIKEKTPEAAIGYFRETLNNWDVERKARARIIRTPKSYEDKTAEKTILEPFKEYKTTGYKDGYSINIPKSAEFINENGESIYIKPNRVLPVSGKGVVLEGKRLVQGGDKGYFETKKEADDALAEWERNNSGKTANVEQDPETKKYIIVTGVKETIRIGKGKNADENLATFKANFGKDLVEEFEKLGVENDKAEKKPAGTWMKTQFYGQVDYSNK